MTYMTVVRRNEKKLLRENYNDVITHYNDYEEKILNLVKRNPDIDFGNIKEALLEGNPFAIALLRKDPIKQNVYENSFFEYVKKVKRLPQIGKGSVSFGPSKAADFKYKNWYGTQKYIKEFGGGQDNQIADMLTFAKYGRLCGEKIIICVDGDYGYKKMHELLKEDKNCVIVNADELKKGINSGRFND